VTSDPRTDDARGTRAAIPSLAQIFWGPLANGFRKVADWRRRGVLGEALRTQQRRSAMRFEALEPRLLLSADLTHVTPPSVALDATLRVDELGGAAILRLIDNPSSAILAEQLIDQDINFSVHGNDQSDRLTIGFDRAALAHRIHVDFHGGEGGTDELVGPDRANTWLLDGPGAGSLDGDGFSGVERLSGGAADDAFVVLDAAVSTAVNGGAGNDSLVGADADNTWNMTAADSGTLNAQQFSGIESLSGGAGTDTLVGSDADNTWVISGENQGALNTVSFSGMENLTGGAGNDTFIFAGGSISGTVDGGAGVNTFDYGSRTESVAVNLETGSANDVAALVNVTRFVGGAGNDTLIGRSE
jgi:Ca2+-binding RTX toxin-like protein